jgi:hypothetical protein
MPRNCTVCEHPQRVEIDRALVGDASNRSLASLYDVSEAAVRRHKANHFPTKLAKAHEAEEIAQADDLLAEVRALQQRTLAILEAAEESQQHRTALAAIREARSNLEMQTKLVGELQTNQLAQAVQINVVYEDERRQRVRQELEEFERQRREEFKRQQHEDGF